MHGAPKSLSKYTTIKNYLRFFIQKSLNNEITGQHFQAAPQMGFQYPSQQHQQHVQQQQQHHQQQQQHYQQQQQGPIRNDDSKESF